MTFSMTTLEQVAVVLRRVLDEFDRWASEPRPAVDGGTVRIHNFREVQPSMERRITEARAVLDRVSAGEP